MHERVLGGLAVPAIGYGAMVLVDGMYGAVDRERAVGAIHAAMDAGMGLLDTSDAYGADGDNERLVGEAVAGRRDEAVIATKWGIVAGPGPHAHRVEASFDNEIWIDARPERAASCAEASLRRLGTDVIDLWYLHFPSPGVPIEETVGAMAEEVRAGRVRHLGLCNVTADQLRRASAVHPIAAVQNEFSLWTRDPEAELLPACRELGTGFVAWGPLGTGFLAGSADAIGAPGEDFRHNAPRFREENLRRNVDRFAGLRAFARERELHPAQLAIAWLLHRDPSVVPIPGSRDPGHIASNAAAADVALTPEDLERIDALAPAGAAAGAALL